MCLKRRFFVALCFCNDASLWKHLGLVNIVMGFWLFCLCVVVVFVVVVDGAAAPLVSHNINYELTNTRMELLMRSLDWNVSALISLIL